METAYKNLGYFFIVLLVFVLWGFSRSYVDLFPGFKDASFVYNFHGVVLLSWMVLLVVQPFLIRYKKINWHQKLGKISYILVPLIMISIFLVSREKYIRFTSLVSKEENIGMILLNIPGMFYFGILYLLAMVNKKNTTYHMRYMIATALLVIGPAAGRVLEYYGGLSFNQSVLYSVLFIELMTIFLIIIDRVNKAPFKPFVVTLIFLIGFHITWIFRSANWWQLIGGFIAEHFF